MKLKKELEGNLNWGNLIFDGFFWNWEPKNWLFGPSAMECGCFTLGIGPLHLQWGHPEGCYWFADFEDEAEDEA